MSWTKKRQKGETSSSRAASRLDETKSQGLLVG